MKKILAATWVAFCLVCSASTSFATPISASSDTLHLAATSGTVSGGQVVYPYYFNIDGSSDLTSLMCMNYNREIRVGETWSVAINSIPLDNSTVSTDYRADAWLFSQMGKYSMSDVQYAVWSIFDPTDVAGNPAYNATAQQLAATSMQMAQNMTLIGSGFFSNYQIYLPTSNTTGWTDGQPQSFVGKAVTPEPASLFLMGTGFFAVFFLYRGKVLGL